MSTTGNTTTTARPSRRLRRIATGGVALALPLSMLGVGAPARADTLAPTYSISANPTDAYGTSLSSTIATTVRGSAWSVISSDDRFTTFASIVRNAGLQSLFQSTSAETFVAPTEAAFAVQDPAVVAKLVAPSGAADAAAYVKGFVSTSVPGVLDYARGASGAVQADVSTTSCPALTYTDAYGNTWVTPPDPSLCTPTSVVTPLAAPIDHLTTLDGQALDVGSSAVSGSTMNGVQVTLGQAAVSQVITVDNGAIDAIDTAFPDHFQP